MAGHVCWSIIISTPALCPLFSLKIITNNWEMQNLQLWLVKTVRPEAWIYQESQSGYFSYFLFSELNMGRTILMGFGFCKIMRLRTEGNNSCMKRPYVHFNSRESKGRNKDQKSEITEKDCCPFNRKISKACSLRSFCFPELIKFSYYVPPFLD